MQRAHSVLISLKKPIAEETNPWRALLVRKNPISSLFQDYFFVTVIHGTFRYSIILCPLMSIFLGRGHSSRPCLAMGSGQLDNMVNTTLPDRVAKKE